MEWTKLRVGEIAALLKRIDEGLAVRGLSSEERAARISECASARCIACQLRLNGPDLLRLASPEAPGEKLQRVQQGYCGRNGCASYFYEIRFEASPGIDWAALVDPPVAAPEPAGVPQNSLPEPRKRTASQWVLLASLIIVVCLWFGRDWYVSGKLPFMKPRYRFQVVVEPQPVQPTNSPPSTATNTEAYPFRVVR